MPDGVGEPAVLGVEAALWTEYIDSRELADFMSYPRLAALAERGWSPAERDWEDFARQLASRGARFYALGVGYYASPEVA